MNNKNTLSIMKVEERLRVDWAQLMFNNMCSEQDRWTKMQEKMQVDGKHEDKKETYHLALFLERLFEYMF